MLIVLLFVIASVVLGYITEKRLREGVKQVADGSYSYALILGAKVNGKIPSKSLEYRLEAGLAYAKQYPQVKLVLSGGQGPGEQISEAEAMRRYLLAHGVEASRLILEDTSTTTYENISFSLRKIGENIDGITIISSDYHLYRSQYIARKFHLEVDVVAAKTPEKLERKLRLRERLAIMKTCLTNR